MKKYQIVIDDMICRCGYSKQFIRAELAKYRGTHVNVNISSLGGDLDHGLDIRQQFIDHGDVTAYLTGGVASAATIIAMGAKRVVMSRYAMFLVHKCSNFIDAWGSYNADEMQRLIDQLKANKQENDSLDVVIAQIYAQKTGKSIADLLEVLKAGRWMTAQQALDYGFIDEIMEDEPARTKFNLTPELKAKFNAFGLPFDGLAPESKEEVKTSVLRQILDFMRGFGAQKSNEQPHEIADEIDTVQDEAPATAAEETSAAAVQDAAPESENQRNLALMENKTFASVMAAIGAESLMANASGAITLSGEQMQALEDFIASQNADLNDRDSRITELQEQVNNLKNLPGDDTKGNLDDTARAALTEEEMYNLTKKFLD